MNMDLKSYIPLYVCLLIKFHFVAYNEAGGQINSLSARNKDKIYSVIGAIVQQCFDKNSGGTVIIGNWSEDSLEMLNYPLFALNPISFIKISTHTVLKKYKRFRKVFKFTENHLKVKNHPAEHFVINSLSNASLDVTLDYLKNSTWWNSRAKVLLVNENIMNSCHLARAFLETIWSYNILSAIYLCRDSNDKLFIYSFNPFTFVHLDFWNADDNNYSSGNYWTLLKYQANELDGSASIENVSVCRSLYFDKTNNLNGYNIKVSTAIGVRALRFYGNKTGFEKFRGIYYDVLATVLTFINVTITFKESTEYGYIDNNGTPHGALNDVMYDAADSQYQGTIFTLHWQWHAYPFSSSGLRIVSLKVPVTFIQRFLNIFTLRVWLFFIFTCILTIVGLKYLLKISMSKAALEFERLFMGMSSLLEPQKSYERLLFTVLLFMIFIFSTVMQSNLSTINTVAEYTPAIDSIMDLVKSDLPVYGGSQYYKELMIRTPLYERFVMMEFDHCVDKLLKGWRITCLMGELTLRYYVYESARVHISKNSFFDTSITFIFREDWPLLPIFNKILLKLNEGGFIILFNDREKYYFVKDTGKVTTITINARNGELKVAFAMLYGGWLLSSVVVSFEIFIELFKKYRNNKIYKKYL